MAKVKLEKGSVFERFEMKYMLDAPRYHALMAALDGKMAPDEYGRHTICTLYYDTDDFAVIRRCLDKPAFREKLRLRSYGLPAQDSTVYLELKKKAGGISYKRRMPMRLAEANGFMQNGLPPAAQGQIYREIDWFRRGRALHGKVVLCYDRVALLGRHDPTLRLTIDAGIRWRDYHLSLDKGDHGALLLPQGTWLMEIKTLNALPCWLAQLLSAHAIYPTAFSKYGTVYRQHLCAGEVMRHAV